MKKIAVLIMVLMIGLNLGCTSVSHTSIHTKKERITGTRVTNNCSVPVLIGAMLQLIKINQKFMMSIRLI